MALKDKSVDPEEMKNEIDPPPIVRKLENDKRTLKKRVNELKMQLGENENYFLELNDAISSFDPSEFKAIGKSSRNTKISNPMSAVFLFSDWHIGECIEPDEIEGFNEFSWAIAKARVSHMINSFCDWVDAARQAGTIDECVVLVAGDFISGSIHEELTVTNEFPVPIQIVKAGHLLGWAIAELSRKFEKVRVENVVADNHSRLTRKPQYKQAGMNSYNYTIGWIAQKVVESFKNVEYNLHPVIKKIVEVQGIKYLVQHGNTIQGWSGFPWYGADRQVSREAKARMNMDNKGFHKMVIGHFHVPMKTQSYIVNGSLSGTSELDHGMGRHSDPCQVGWLAHPKFGEYSFSEFWLNHVDHTKNDTSSKDL